MEKGRLEKSQVETLAAHVRALGGTLKLIADFGDETYVLGRGITMLRRTSRASGSRSELPGQTTATKPNSDYLLGGCFP
jgi:hypothetical protein